MSAEQHLTSYRELAEVIDALPLLCREHRRAHGLSLRSAATQAGVPFANLARLEAGRGYHISTGVAVLRWLGGAA